MIKRPDKNSLPRLRLLPPYHALKVLLSRLKGQNTPVKTAASDEQIATIERKSLRVPSSGTDVVSFLQTGSPDGRRIIFVHGTPGNARGWADYLLNTPDGCLRIALDRLGYGLSEPTHAVVSLKRQAQAVLPFLEKVNGQKAILVGHSSGASVAMQVALDYPAAVGGLLLLAGAFDPDLEEANWLQPLGTLKPISRLLPRAINNANRELLGLKRELLGQADRLHEVNIPVSVVHGDSDPLVPVANLDYLQRKLKNAPLDKLVLKQVDHFIPWHSKLSVDASLKRLIDTVQLGEL
jgi:pimeloyl-ACP methyl ester carboxylesterase